MKQNRVEALVRTFLVLALALFGAGVSALSAQTGKIDGRVKTADGKPIAEAQVIVVGQAFQTTTNKEGYFFINNVPSGLVDVRVSAVTYRPATVTDLRVTTGQTITTRDFVLEPAGATQLAEITIAATTPLIDRTKSTSAQVLDKDFVKALPETRIATLLALSPGVSRPLVGDTNRLSVRGSRYTENALYVDGVPVQRIGSAGAELDIATNSFEDVSLVTGAPSAQFGNALGGIINVTTRSGGRTLQSSLSWDTGMLGGAYAKGQNSLQLNLSGPLPVKNLSFSLSGRIEGTAWNNTGYQGWLFPVYTTVGVDTSFNVPYRNAITTSSFNNPRADSVTLKVYQTAVISGDCDQFYFVKDAALAEMRDNYGVSCEKSRTFVNPNTAYRSASRLDYQFGRGSRLSLSYNWTGNQSRPRLLADGRTVGTITNGTVALLQLNQNLITRPNRNVTLKASVSIQGNSNLSSPITVESEKQTREPFSGFMLRKMDMVYDKDNFPVDSAIIRAFLTQSTFRTSLIPTLNANTAGVTAPSVGGVGGVADGVPYRDYYSTLGGSDVTGYNWSTEDRKVYDAQVDAQVDRWNRLTFGGTLTKSELKNFSGGIGTSNWYRPEFLAFFVQDQIDLSDVVLNVGLRYDRFDYNLKRWDGFPRISTAAGFDKLNPDLVMKEDEAHDYIAPRINVAFPITQQTNFRLSYAQSVQAPPFGTVATNHKSDIDRSGVNSRSSFGYDVDFAKTIQFEFGVSHAFSDDMTMDLAFYNKDNLANAAFKFANLVDPKNGEKQLLYLLQNTDFGNSRGIEFSLNRQIGNYLNGRLNYSYADTRNTGSDPSAFLNFFEGIIGGLGEPPLQPLPTAQSVPHTLNGVFSLTLPADFQKGKLLGKVAGGLGVGATFQLQSGAPYTRCDPAIQSNLALLSGASSSCTTLDAVQGYLQSRLPMTKSLNTSFRKTFNFGKRSVAAYLNVNNLLNLTNTFQVYATTGTTSNPQVFANQWANDSISFINAAVNHGFLAGDNSMVLPSSTAGCAKVSSTTNSLAQSCFYWMRSEQRFGNGDGRYTLEEWHKVSDVVNAKSRHISNFVRGFRTMTFGINVNF